jgi:hypothetical protein
MSPDGALEQFRSNGIGHRRAQPRIRHRREPKVVQWPIDVLLASTGFGLVYYFAPDAEQEWAYGALGAIILTLLWFYITGLAMVIGAELNAEIGGHHPGFVAPGRKSWDRKSALAFAASREGFKTHPGTKYALGKAWST